MEWNSNQIHNWIFKFETIQINRLIKYLYYLIEKKAPEEENKIQKPSREISTEWTQKNLEFLNGKKKAMKKIF